MQDFHFHTNFIFRTPINSTNQLIDENLFNEALFLSTPTLHNELEKEQKDLKKINLSLYKYKTRARTRCTPFGMFAGLGIGNWEDNNTIQFEKDLKKRIKRKTRLDMNVLYTLAQELAKQEYVKPYLKFFPNNSIYLIANTYRYVEYYYLNNQRYHKVNKVDYSIYLQTILSKSQEGLTKQELVSLITDPEITKEDVTNFIDELIDSQLLISHLQPTLTGSDYFIVLTETLKTILDEHHSNELLQLINLFDEIDVFLKAIDTDILNPIESYKKIHVKLKSILPELTETNLFQTDLYKETKTATLSNEIQEKLKQAVHFLNKITPPTVNKNLENFKKRFEEIYESSEISLLLALDAEAGIGYPSKDSSGINELIEDVYYSNNNTGKEINWNAYQTNLLKLITNSIKLNKKIIEISDDDFKDIDYSESTLPHSYSIMFNVLNTETNKLNIGAIGGSSAVNLLGRFAGGSTKLNEVVSEIVAFENTQLRDKIIAEIVHLPESRTGNILARPGFREYEIPYLAQSTVAQEFQLKMSNLVLKLVDGKIILFDKHLQKEIIPRLGNAHNYTFNSLPLYHFLCDLQTQYYTKSYLGFNWGELSSNFGFLPRVEYQGAILQPATWNLNKNDLVPFQKKNTPEEDKKHLFYELKNSLELPDLFLIADGDNELLIDCNDSIAIDVFINSIKNRNSMVLTEYLFDSENSLITDTDENPYTNECIAIILNNHLKKDSTVTPVEIKLPHKNSTSKRQFSIGSEWLYYKIYCGPHTADFIITEKIKPIAEKLLNDGIIDQWFFIRYADPENHLRFRMHFNSTQNINAALQLIHQEIDPLMEEFIVSKIQLDTYKRELERYGDNSIILAEQLFYSDSVFVANMLNLMDSENGGKIRWKMALRSVDHFLNDFHFNLADKINLISSLSNSFFNEHGGKKELKLILDQKYRTLKPEIEEVLNTDNDVEKEYYPLIEFLNDRSIFNQPIINELLLLQSSNLLQVPLNELIASFLHMNLDRLFMGRNRTNEFVVYDILSRTYKSIQARSLKQNLVVT